jgi:hypothetical protein
MSLSLDTLRERYLELVATDYLHFLRLLNEAEARLLETAKWNWCKVEAELPVEAGYLFLDPSEYAALLGVILDDGARVIRPREVEFTPNGPGRSEPDKPGPGHLIDCGIVRVVDVSGIPQTLTVAGIVFNDTPLDPLSLTRGADIAGFPSWTGTVPGAPNNVTLGRPGAVVVFLDTTEPHSWVIMIDDSETYYATSVGVTPTPVGLTNWTVFWGAGTPTVTGVGYPAGPPLRRRKYKLADVVHADTVACLLHLAHVPMVEPDDLTACPSARALKLAMMAVGYEEVDDLERAKTYWADAYAALSEQEATQRGGVRGSATIQPFGDGIRPVDILS